MKKLIQVLVLLVLATFLGCGSSIDESIGEVSEAITCPVDFNCNDYKPPQPAGWYLTNAGYNATQHKIYCYWAAWPYYFATTSINTPLECPNCHCVPPPGYAACSAAPALWRCE